MKTLVAVTCLVAFTLAEPPPSNSYLPPSSGRSGGSGYPSGGPQGPAFGGGPQVIAARNQDHNHGSHGAGANGFARNSPSGHGGHGAQARFGLEGQGYDHNAAAIGRNGLDDVSGEPASYNFGYMVNDYQEGTDFGHHEERQDERAEGEYHVVLPDGRKQTVSYEADEGGFKPHISYEDSDSGFGRSGGYDANANNVHGNHGNGFNGAHGNHGNKRSGGY